MRFGIFLMRHHRLMGWVGAAFHRTRGPWRYRTFVPDDPTKQHCFYCVSLNAAVQKLAPDFGKDAEKGRADLKAGRAYDMGYPGTIKWWFAHVGLDFPSKTWRGDDPEQPDGWYHNGRGWRPKRDGGWAKDKWGYWRYTKPGDLGWVEQPDGHWKYYIEPGVERQEA